MVPSQFKKIYNNFIMCEVLSRKRRGSVDTICDAKEFGFLNFIKPDGLYGDINFDITIKGLWFIHTMNNFVKEENDHV